MKNKKKTIGYVGLILIMIFPSFSCSQSKTSYQKSDLVGIWLINEIKVNGTLQDGFDPKIQDEINLKDNDIHITTDKANDYEQSGPWKIVKGRFIELSDATSGEKQLLEIISFDGFVLDVRIMADGDKIEMRLKRK